MNNLKIDIVSDVVCPWCAIGFANLSTALTQLSLRNDADIQWHPFQLNPSMPKEGQDIGEHLHEKYGLDDSQRGENQQRLKQAGDNAGVEFNFHERSRIYNTFECHILLELAAQFQKQTELKLALFKAYFTEGKNISDQNILIDVWEGIGLDINDAKAALSNETLIEKVISQEEYYKRMGIQSVPAFIINDKYLVSGGQPVENFKQSIQQIMEREASE